MRRYLAGIVAATALAVLPAAPASGAATHAEYVAEVNPICKEGAAAAKRATKKVRPSGNPATTFIRRTVAFQRAFKRMLRRINSVEPPPETARDIDEWTDGLRQQKRLNDRFIAAAKRADAVRFVRLSRRIIKAQKRNGNQARRLDLTRCTAQ